jgi:hypothetical protein
MGFRFTAFVAFLCLIFIHVDAQSYLKGDFHQHTTYTDGSFSIGYMMKKNNQFGLDWWANSEHGGTSLRNARISGLESGNGQTVYWDEYQPAIIQGTEKVDDGHRVMWRWQVLKDSSFAEILKARKLYPDKTIIQSYEMNIPGHEHGSLGIITHQFDSLPNCNTLAEFEYKFDQGDTDTLGGALQGWSKSKLSGHAKTIEALTWLRKNHPNTSYLVIAHPERYPQNTRGYSIVTIRDMNNVAPNICFGFESIPGHHRESTRPRGLYETSSVGGGTYGGAGIYCAKIGGMWDALLSEGRHFWLFANSDCHSEVGDFYPGEYLKNYTYTQGKSAQQIVDGLRSGNTWVVMGDLIDSLIYHVELSGNKKYKASMGSELHIPAGKTIKITIKVRDPLGNNFNIYSDYNNPVLNHIDVIQGKVTGIVTTTWPEYNKDSVNTTSVVARFDAVGNVKDGNGLVSKKWKNLENGWIEMSFEVRNVTRSLYFRLRGTNHALNASNETDNCGNPLCDTLMEPNSAAKAFADLWFYSNPVFVTPVENK